MRTHYHTLEQGILLLVVGDVRLAGPADVGGVPADAHRQSDVGRICPRLRMTRRYHRLKIRRFFVIIVNSMLARLRRLTLCVINYYRPKIRVESASTSSKYKSLHYHR